ncbi:hypothetical protein PLESTF_000643700 [Pleodorina starrii]|nr:hypothetical protein PLESTF_000643700 [Pleodorina starrii]
MQLLPDLQIGLRAGLLGKARHVLPRAVRLYLVETWWSNRSSGLPLTLFTMASLDRLPMLEAMCRGYMGPISAAVYLPLLAGTNASHLTGTNASHLTGAAAAAAATAAESPQGGAGGPAEPLPEGATAASAADLILREHGEQISSARAKLQAFFERMDALRAADGSVCQLALTLFAERTSDPQLAAIMPTNAMRNAAGLAAQTPLAAMLDADLGVSAGLNTLVNNETWIQHILRETSAQRPALCVPPAFEANPRLDNETAHRVTHVALAGTYGRVCAATRSKSDVAALWRNATLKVFHVDACRSCHRPFNHAHWSLSPSPYIVEFQRNFEPWGILSRFQDPGYDERFRGWCFDKMQHVESLARLKDFRFVVLPDIWLVHRPHEKVAIAKLQHQHREKQHNGTKTSEKVNVLLSTVRLPDGRSATAYKHYTSYVHALMRRERAALSAGDGYAPQLNPQLAHCRSALPWWQRPQRQQQRQG